MARRKMTEKYRGFTLEAKREPAYDGRDDTYWSAVRDSDRWVFIDATTTDDVEWIIGYMKGLVDECLANPADYDDPSVAVRME